MRKPAFDDAAASRWYLALRIVPSLAAVSFLAAMAVRAWKPAAQIGAGMPFLLPALFACWAVPLVASFLLFSRDFRPAFLVPALSAAAAAVALLVAVTPGSGPGAEFDRITRTFGATACAAAFIGSLGLGTLFARGRTASSIEAFLVEGFGLLALAALQGERNPAALPAVAAVMCWYAVHAFLVDHAFASLPPAGAGRRRFAAASAARYALIAALLFASFFVFSAVFAGCERREAAGGAASPYENKGRPRDEEDSANDKELERLSGAGSYIHSLKPEVKLDEKYNPGEKTLLYNVYVKAFDGKPVEEYYRSREWRDFKALYLGRFVLSAYDPEKDVFSLDSKESERASFFGEPMPFDRVKLSPNAVVPLGKGGDGKGPRKSMSLVVSLTPFIDGDEAISPDYPVALSVLLRMSDAEARRALAESIRRYGPSSLEAERVYVSAYALEARALPNGFAGLDSLLAAGEAARNKGPRLSAEDREYYTLAGGDADAIRLRELAREVTGGKTDPIEAARSIRDFFVLPGEERPAEWGKPFTYDFEPGKAAAGGSDLQAFVFDHRRGYCQYYALASAVMLRSLGIPARVIAGYLGIDRSARNPGYYYIYSNQAHAWTEVFADGLGWVQFDATPSPPPSLEGLLGPPGPDGTPPEFPDAPEWSVVTYFGKAASAEGKRLAFLPEYFHIGSPADFSKLEPEARAKIPELYAKSFPPGPRVEAGRAGMVVEFEDAVAFFRVEGSAKGKAGMSVEGGVRPADAAARIARLAEAEVSGGQSASVALVGKFRTKDVMSGRSGLSGLEPEFELVGVYPEGAPSAADAAASRKAPLWPWLIVAAALAVVAALFPLSVYLLVRSAVDAAPAGEGRARALLEYMRYRLALVGVRPYGLSLSEWGRWLGERFSIDLSGPVAAIEEARYGGAEAFLDAARARALRRAFEAAFHAAVPMEKTLLSIFDPIAAASYIRGRGLAALARASRRRAS